MAELSWPSPDDGRTVNERQYELICAQTTDDGLLMDVSGAQIDPGGIAPVYGDSSGLQYKIAANLYGNVRGFGWTSGTSVVTKSIAANAAGSTRYDRVVLELDRSTWNVRMKTVQGTAGGGLPALTRSVADSGLFQVHIATVTVTAGAGTITAGNVDADGCRIGTKVRAWKNMADAVDPRLGQIGYDEALKQWFGWNGTDNILFSPPDYTTDPNGYVKNDVVTTTSTSATENAVGGAAQVITDFIAGEKGSVNIRVYGGLFSSVAGKATILGARVYDDPAGAVLWDSADHDGARTYDVANTTCASEMIVRGLTPGNPYLVKLTYKVDSGNTGTFHDRKVYVTPW
jgi:imidazole glycerol phosphate synthase subunit HisF